MNERSSKKNFVRALQDRTKNFAVDIIRFCQGLPESREARIISNQLIRCGTSIGSNYRAACRGRSGKEFYTKMCVVVEEADETFYWLEIIEKTGIKRNDKLEYLINEANEILSIVVTSRKTAGKNLD